jgi:hypothetical protein
MYTRARSLAEALEASPDLASVFRDLERSRRAVNLLAGAVASAGITLTPAACNWRSSQLTLTVGSASQGAKLRQLLPTLESLLHRNGFEGTQMRVRVQPDATPYPIRGQSAVTDGNAANHDVGKRPARLPTPAASAFAAKLAQTNDKGPLSAAARRLDRVIRERLTKTRHRD